MSRGLDSVYQLASAEAAASFYDRWAANYEDELAQNGYITPVRCATALAEHASLPWAPLIELGCGTGLGGLALREAGFDCIDGLDISPAMLEKAAAKDCYRTLGEIDLSAPLDAIPEDTYQNAAAIGVFNPNFMPATVIDRTLEKLPAGGCFVFSLNDHALAEGLVRDPSAGNLRARRRRPHLQGVWDAYPPDRPSKHGLCSPQTVAR